MRLKKIVWAKPNGEKQYRGDLKMWEQKHLFLGKINFWKYSLFNYPKPIVKFTLFRKNKATVNIIGCQPLTPIRIGRQEFEQKYKNNKWLVPTDCIIDLTKP